MSDPGPGPGRSTDLHSRLAGALLPLHTPIARLPVGGYRPDSSDRPRAAAVLVGITEDDPAVVLTLRSTRLARHAGQVAFPGGAREAQDRSVVDTALREAHEEAGIDPDFVRPSGYLSRYDTITGYRMTAVVGVLSPDVRLEADQSEVERVFTVPLADVANPDCYRSDRVRYEGRRFDILTLSHPGYRIWGATAALLFELGERLRSGSTEGR